MGLSFNRKVRRLFFYFHTFGLYLFTPPTFAKEASDSDCSTARSLVEKFLQLDGDVGRVSTKEFNATFVPLFTKGMDEPGWDTFTVIKGYQITKCEKDAKGFALTVSCQSAGEITWEARNGLCPLFKPNEKTENLTAHVMREGGKWKINETPGNPHLSAKRSEGLVADSRKECTKEISEAIRLIRKAVPSHP